MEIKDSLVVPPRVTIELTKEQMEQIASLREGKEGGFAIFGQALSGLDTADFYYFNDEQAQIVNRAILRARKVTGLL